MAFLLVPPLSDRILKLNKVEKSTELVFWLYCKQSGLSLLVGRNILLSGWCLFWGLSLESHCWLIYKSSRRTAYYLYTLYCQKPTLICKTDNWNKPRSKVESAFFLTENPLGVVFRKIPLTLSLQYLFQIAFLQVAIAVKCFVNERF